MKKIKSLYIHFPFCEKKCNYCDFYKTTNYANNVEQFKNYLEQTSATIIQKAHDQNYEIKITDSIYIGGGTPSLWEEGPGFLQSSLFKKLNILKKDMKQIEFTVEMNPSSTLDRSVNNWLDLGVNRVSLGIQTLNPNLLTLLNRAHDINQSHNALDLISAKFKNFSTDFMIGLPHSEKFNRNIIHELKTILKYNPTHISLYILTPGESYSMKQHLPSDDYIANEFMTASNFLKDYGFQHYEVSNFAYSRLESKHNLKYWKSKSVIALGPSATGIMINNSNAFRYTWKKDLLNYNFDYEHLTEEEIKLEKIYMLLRTNLGINISEFFKESDLTKLNYLIKKWASLNYIFQTDFKIVLNSRGFLFIDSIMNDLFSII